MVWGKKQKDDEYGEEMRKAEEGRILAAIKENEEIQKSIGEIAVIAASPHLIQIREKLDEIDAAIAYNPQSPHRVMPVAPTPDPEPEEEDIEEEEDEGVREEYEKEKAKWLASRKKLSELKKKLK